MRSSAGVRDKSPRSRSPHNDGRNQPITAPSTAPAARPVPVPRAATATTDQSAEGDIAPRKITGIANAHAAAFAPTHRDGWGTAGQVGHTRRRVGPWARSSFQPDRVEPEWRPPGREGAFKPINSRPMAPRAGTIGPAVGHPPSVTLEVDRP